MRSPLLEVDRVSKVYREARVPRREAAVTALDGVSLRVAEGETLGLLGESGSGKTTLARILLRFEEATSGRVALRGLDWFSLRGEALRKQRRKIQIVFQDASSSLAPNLTAGRSIEEPLRGCLGLSGRELHARSEELLTRVGLSRDDAGRYPHEFSGGERQRIAIARAIAPEPSLVVCDEPVSSLDPSVAAQILNLFREIQERTAVSYLFISHDSGAVASLSDRIAVLKAGRLVEEGATAELLAAPRSAYTASLLGSARR